MTNAKTIGALRMKVSELAGDLHEARADVELYARLQGAAARAKTLQSEYSEAMSALRKAEIADEKKQRDLYYRGLSDIEIVEVGDEHGGGILRSVWRITYTVNAFNGYSTQPTRATRNGFEELEPHVLAFLIERHPEKVPAKIMALAPDDPGKAIGTFLQGKRRGYLSEKAA